MGILGLLLRLFRGKPRKRNPRSNDAGRIALAGHRINGTAWVIDGDTLVIGDRTIRLHGIDAPELDHPYGKNAKWALVKLCKGHRITAVFDGTSTHDRPVAICTLPDGRDLSAEMVRLGFAIDWKKHSGGKYRHLETPEARRLFWRADARQKGRFPPTPRQ